MRPIIVIALREWRSLFLSPLAWTLLGVLFAISAYMFNAALVSYLLRMQQFQMMGGGPGAMSLTEWTIAPMFGNTAVLLLLIIPLITMRTFAEEKRRDTWPALASSPLSPMQIILGKYVGLLLFFLVTVLLLGLLPLGITPYGNPDGGQVLSCMVGLFLLTAAFSAIGLAASSATDNPIVAAIATFGVLLGLWIAAWMGESGGGNVEKVLTYLSLTNHYENFLKGVISSTDLLYFLLLSALGLLVARQRLTADRIRG